MADRRGRRDDDGRAGGFRGSRRDGGPHRYDDPRQPGRRGEGGRPWDRGQRSGDRPPGRGERFGSRPRRFEGEPREPGDSRRDRSERPGGPDAAPGEQGEQREWRPRERSPEWRQRQGGDRPRRQPEGDWRDRPRREGPPPFGRPRPPFRGPARADFRPAPPPSADLLQPEEELVAGRRPVEEAFAARREPRRLLVVPERRAALEALVLHATTLRIPIVEVEGGTLTQLSGFDGHQGVAVALAARQPVGLDDVLARARERAEAPFVLVLDSLEDPQNLGTLLRSAEACAVHGVIFPTRRSAPLSPSAIKASAGATEHLLLMPVDDLAGTLVDLRSRGLRLIGADEGAPLRYGEADLRGPLALVVGSEERGISGALRRRLDLAVRIPMRGKIGSLNAAVAGSVLLFAAAEQRGTLEAGDPAAGEAEELSRTAEQPAAEQSAAEPTPKAATKPVRRTRAKKAQPAAETQPAAEAQPVDAEGADEGLLPGDGE